MSARMGILSFSKVSQDSVRGTGQPLCPVAGSADSRKKESPAPPLPIVGSLSSWRQQGVGGEVDKRLRGWADLDPGGPGCVPVYLLPTSASYSSENESP